MAETESAGKRETDTPKGWAGVSRDPYWEEMSDAQRIEKLGSICVTQQHRIEELLEAVSVLSTPHAHLDGKMMVEAVPGTRGMGPILNQVWDEWRHGRHDLLNRDPDRGPRLR